MEPSATASLSALRDIHLPDPVSIWPLAPGWWLLGGLLLLAGTAAALVWVRRQREPVWSKVAAEELAGIEATFVVQRDVVVLATSLSSLLRRTVLARFPEEKVAALRGDAWFELLCDDAGAPNAENRSRRSPRVVRELTETAFAGASAATGEPDEWIAFVRSWIGASA